MLNADAQKMIDDAEMQINLRSPSLILNLVEEYHYQEIPPMFSETYHNIFRSEIPNFLSENGADVPLYDLCGIGICKRYNRVVIGDYGAFVEISDKDIEKENLRIQPGQEYRLNDERYSKNVKYVWWTTRGKAFPKLYQQKRTVPYADYRIGFWYVSPFEITIERFL